MKLPVSLLCLIAFLPMSLASAEDTRQSWGLSDKDRQAIEDAQFEAALCGEEEDCRREKPAVARKNPRALGFFEATIADFLAREVKSYVQIDHTYDYAGDCDKSGRTAADCYRRWQIIRRGDPYKSDDLFWRDSSLLHGGPRP